MKTKIKCIFPVLFLILGAPLAAKATTVTTTYEFLPDQSTMVWYFGLYGRLIPHSIEGQFQLTIDFDAGSATFDYVDAVLTNGQPPPYNPNMNLNGERLDDIFYLTELVSTDVSEATIDFAGQFDLAGLENILVELTFVGDSVHLVGSREFAQVVPDGNAYWFNAVAIPEPGTLLVFAVGGLIIRKGMFLRYN